MEGDECVTLDKKTSSEKIVIEIESLLQNLLPGLCRSEPPTTYRSASVKAWAGLMEHPFREALSAASSAAAPNSARHYSFVRGRRKGVRVQPQPLPSKLLETTR